MLSRKLFSYAAWATLAFVAFATLSPFSLRPELTTTEPDLVVMIERVGAFGLLGFLFLISYPERLLTVCAVVFGSAIALEITQAFLPDRHARILDALEKIVGSGAGILLGLSLLPVLIALGGQRTNRWLPTNQVDRDVAELTIGLFVLLLFMMALVAFRNL